MMRAIFGATGDYDRLDRYLHEAEALAGSIGDVLRLAQVNVAKALTLNFRGDLDASIHCGVRARDLAGNIGNHSVSLAATVYIGQARMWRGDFQQAVDLLDSNTWTKGALRHERIITTGTTSVLWLGMLGASAAYLGDFARAAPICQQACEIADEGRRPYDVALAYWYAGFVASHQGDVSKASIDLEHAWGVCNTNQVYSLLPILGTTLGYTYALSGRLADGIKHLERAVGLSCKANFAYAEAWSTTYLGFAKAIAGQYAHVLKDASRALELARKHNFRAVEAAALRLLGDYHLRNATRDAKAAEAQYSLGSDIASECGMRPELAHCLRGLAEARLTLGKSCEAQIVLERSRKLCNEMGLKEVAGLGSR
jgi:tetratricopeptide (TPR) repeat protein